MRAAARASVLLYLLGAVLIIYAHAATDYGIPIEIKLWDTGRSPLSYMVDVTNQFGLKVLTEHSFLNDNNIAFSPYGLMGILVALYEGVDGESSYQIQRSMQLPWNRNVIRIGFRDIHRTLKTYFVPEEGFLAGLALNNENVTFNKSYRKILRFYGFDLEDKLPSLPANNDTVESSTSSGADSVSDTVTMVTEHSTPSQGDLSTDRKREEITPNPNAETFNDIDIRMPTSLQTTINPFSTPTDENNNLNPITTLITADLAAENVRSTTLTIDSTAAADSSILPAQSAVIEMTTPTVTTLNSVETITFISTSSTSTAAKNDDEQIVPIGNQEPMAATFSTTNFGTEQTTSERINMQEQQITSTLQVPRITTTTTSVTEQSITTSAENLATDLSTPENKEPNIEPLKRRKKSLSTFIFTNPPYISDDIMYRAFDIPTPVSSNQNSYLGGDHNVFLANGLKTVQVSYMEYDSVLEHAYLPHLEAAALRLPLDSERYYLLAVLPARAHAAELARLLARLARGSDLRDIYAALRPRRVKALLPSFTVKGHVTLTADLQKLGIRDVFEPRQRDFTPMTPQAGVYVRSIEQAVSVAIRKYGTDDRNNSRYAQRQPVHFSATYPFLYFVMDASIHVALMAGKMADPLNSRIL